MSNSSELTNGVVIDEDRPGWEVPCPGGDGKFKYTVLNLSVAEPFLYCERCSNFVLCREYADRLARKARGGDPPSLADLREVYTSLEADLPPCPCGGRFTLTATAKCPRGGHPLQRFIDDDARFYAAKIIWVRGAIAFRGPSEPSNRLSRVTR